MHGTEGKFPGKVNSNTPPREFFLGTINTSYLERFDGLGRTHVSTRLVQQIFEDGRTYVQAINCESVETLENIAVRSEALQQKIPYAKTFDAEKPQHAEKIGDYHVQFWGIENPDGQRDIAIHIKDVSDGDVLGDGQAFLIDNHRLKKIVEVGRDYEQEISKQDRSFAVLKVQAPGKEADYASGKVVRLFDKIQDAEIYAYGENKGGDLVVWPAPISLKKGEEITVSKGASKEVDREIANAHYDRNRDTEHYVLVKWTNADRLPQEGQTIGYDAMRRAYNNEARDYDALPIGGPQSSRSQPSDKPFYVILEKDEHRPFQGKVVASFTERDKGTERLAEMEGKAQIEKDSQLAATVNFHKQSFGPRQIEM